MYILLLIQDTVKCFKMFVLKDHSLLKGMIYLQLPLVGCVCVAKQGWASTSSLVLHLFMLVNRGSFSL